MTLTNDAIIFGLAFLNGPKATLSFGGEGAKLEITPRARDALNCLLNGGFAEVAEPLDHIKGREHYRGKGAIGPEARAAGINLFDPENCWPTFLPKGGEA